MERFAPAKLNLTLDVLGKRPDGYHDLKMVMQSSPWGIPSPWSRAGRACGCRPTLPFLPTGPRTWPPPPRSASMRRWDDRCRDWRSPSASASRCAPGWPGGSTDAAAVLRALNEKEGNPFSMEELARVGEGVGSDVPLLRTGRHRLGRRAGGRC